VENRNSLKEDGGRAAVTVFVCFIVICLFAVFTPGGPVLGTHGIVYFATGVLMLLFPPKYKVSRMVAASGFLLVLFSAGAFLPADWFGKSELRTSLEALELPVGELVSAHPGQTGEFLLGLGMSVVIGFFLLGHRIAARGLSTAASVFSTGVGVYALISILAHENGWEFAWDSESSFGLFPNRNHTATLLAMGSICGLGVLFQSINEKRWILASIVGISLGISIWAILGYTGSRSGPLLLALGGLVWFVMLGKRWMNHKMVISATVLGVLTVVLFFASDTGVKERLLDTVEKVSENDIEIEGDQQSTNVDSTFDFRVLIYKDTWSMIKAEPVTGVGLGLFRYRFPAYRDVSATNSVCLHPESDWLWVVTETGIASALVLLILIVLVVKRALHGARRSRSWPLRLACLLAALVVPFHGIFDVPGHRIGLSFSALLLIALSFRNSKGTPDAGKMYRSGFRAIGVVVGIAGLLLIRGEWVGGAPAGIVEHELLAEEIRKLHAEDQASGGAQDGEDKLEQALQVAQEAIAKYPLVPELHYLRGAMALYFDDKDDLVRRSFETQRVLDTIWVNVPLRQATSWMEIDPKEALLLWEDALRRAGKMALVGGQKGEPVRVWSEIVREALKAEGDLYLQLLGLTEDEPARLIAWVQNCPEELMDSQLPEILKNESLKEDEKRELVKIWHRRSKNRSALEQYLEVNPAPQPD
jgi:O-antigen ligase